MVKRTVSAWVRSGSWRGLEANADEAGIFEALLAFVDIRACVKHSFCRISQHEKLTISTLISAGLQPGKGIGEGSFSSHCRFNRADGVGCNVECSYSMEFLSRSQRYAGGYECEVRRADHEIEAGP